MIPRFLKGMLDYALGSIGNPRIPEVIAGNTKSFKETQAAAGGMRRTRHFTLSYAKKDRPTKAEVIEDVYAYHAQTAAAIKAGIDIRPLMEDLVRELKRAAESPAGSPTVVSGNLNAARTDQTT